MYHTGQFKQRSHLLKGHWVGHGIGKQDMQVWKIPESNWRPVHKSKSQNRCQTNPVRILPLHHHWALDAITTQTHTATTPKHRTEYSGHCHQDAFSMVLFLGIIYCRSDFPGTYLAKLRLHASVLVAKDLGKQRPNLFSVCRGRWALVTSKTCNTGRVMRFCKALDDQGLLQVDAIEVTGKSDEMRSGCWLNCIFYIII